MANKKKKKGDYVNMDVSPELLDDEIDAVTGKESADDDPRLDEALIGGEVDAKITVQNVYKNLSSVVGEYYGSYTSVFFDILSHAIPLIVLIGFYVYGILSAVRGEFTLFTALIVLACTAVMGTILYTIRKQKISVWWWKEKNRTVSVYKIEKGKYKGDVIVYVNKKYMWRYDKKHDKWEINELDLMGSRLFFSKLNGELRSVERKNGDVIISAYKREEKLVDLWGKKSESARLVLKNGIPFYIENIVRDRIQRAARRERFYFKEINKEMSVSLPRSFKNFCEENVIEPLEESERLYYE